MTLLELFEKAGLVLLGGGGLQGGRMLFRAVKAWRAGTAIATKVDAEAHAIAADTALDVGAGVRKDITFALSIQREQIASLNTEVVTVRRENRRLLDEHTECKVALAKFSVELARRDLEIDDLRQKLGRCEEQLREAFAILRERRVDTGGFDASTTLPRGTRSPEAPTPPGGVRAGVDGPGDVSR